MSFAGRGQSRRRRGESPEFQPGRFEVAGSQRRRRRSTTPERNITQTTNSTEQAIQSRDHRPSGEDRPVTESRTNMTVSEGPILPEEPCPICGDPLSQELAFCWPSCAQGRENRGHWFHHACIIQYQPMARALAHLMRTSDADRIMEVTCPICQTPWGDSERANSEFMAMIQAIDDQGLSMPTYGCRCEVCRSIGAGPQVEDEPMVDYGPPPAAADAPLFRP